MLVKQQWTREVALSVGDVIPDVTGSFLKLSYQDDGWGDTAVSFAVCGLNPAKSFIKVLRYTFYSDLEGKYVSVDTDLDITLPSYFGNNPIFCTDSVFRCPLGSHFGDNNLFSFTILTNGYKLYFVNVYLSVSGSVISVENVSIEELAELSSDAYAISLHWRYSGYYFATGKDTDTFMPEVIFIQNNVIKHCLVQRGGVYPHYEFSFNPPENFIYFSYANYEVGEIGIADDKFRIFAVGESGFVYSIIEELDGTATVVKMNNIPKNPSKIFVLNDLTGAVYFHYSNGEVYVLDGANLNSPLGQTLETDGVLSRVGNFEYGFFGLMSSTLIDANGVFSLYKGGYPAGSVTPVSYPDVLSNIFSQSISCSHCVSLFDGDYSYFFVNNESLYRMDWVNNELTLLRIYNFSALEFNPVIYKDINGNIKLYYKKGIFSLDFELFNTSIEYFVMEQDTLFNIPSALIVRNQYTSGNLGLSIIDDFDSSQTVSLEFKQDTYFDSSQTVSLEFKQDTYFAISFNIDTYADTEMTLSPFVMTEKTVLKSGYYNFVYLLQSDNKLYVTGNNYDGQLGLGDKTTRTSFVALDSSFDNPLGFWLGHDYSLVLKSDGTLWGCGNNHVGQLGSLDGGSTFLQFPSDFNNPENIYNHTNGYTNIVRKSDGTLWYFGRNYCSSVYFNSYNWNFNEITSEYNNVKDIYVLPRRTFTVKNDGTVWFIGYNEYGESHLGNTNSLYTTFTQLDSSYNNAKLIAGGTLFTFIVKSDGTTWVAGRNRDKECGIVATSPVTTPVQLPSSFDNPLKIISGSDETLFLKSDGTLWGCGYNVNGKLGLGAKGSFYFTQIASDTSDSATFAITDYSSSLVKKDKTYWASGSNYDGSFGFPHANTNVFVQGTGIYSAELGDVIELLKDLDLSFDIACSLDTQVDTIIFVYVGVDSTYYFQEQDSSFDLSSVTRIFSQDIIFDLERDKIIDSDISFNIQKSYIVDIESIIFLLGFVNIQSDTTLTINSLQVNNIVMANKIVNENAFVFLNALFVVSLLLFKNDFSDKKEKSLFLIHNIMLNNPIEFATILKNVFTIAKTFNLSNNLNNKVEISLQILHYFLNNYEKNIDLKNVFKENITNVYKVINEISDNYKNEFLINNNITSLFVDKIVANNILENYINKKITLENILEELYNIKINNVTFSVYIRE